ncbi:MAG TPA: hypothetical protein GXX23_00835 [Firmicutes bacterium]|nr:hypothetical protein [Candidatus Fermentithermobacillaceae bacterium]
MRRISSSGWMVLAIAVCVVLCLVLPPGPAATKGPVLGLPSRRQRTAIRARI